MHFTTFFGLLATASAASTSKPAGMLARGEDGDITCSTSHMVQGTQERENFVEGQNSLRDGDNPCGVDYGHCSRVSCSNNAAVWLCNNSNHDFSGMDCSIFPDYVDHIFDKCQESGVYAVDYCSGTMENSDGWTIEVGYNDC